VVLCGILVDMPQTTTTPARDERLRRGLTLRQLAQQCADKGVPVDFGQLSRIERGKYAPNPRLRAVLAEILELHVNDFDKPTA
jgi:transcriptional regulator with XRE-family HTH domain